MLTALLYLALCQDALPDSLPDALPDANTSSGVPATADSGAIPSPLPIPETKGASAAQPSAPTAPAASVLCYVWGARWCTWCHLMSPTVRQLRDEGWPIYEYDVDQHQNMAAAWEAFVLPTVIVLRIDAGEGVTLERVARYQTYDELRAMLVRNGVKQDTSKLPNMQPPVQGRAGGACAGGSCGTFRWRGR